MRVSKMLGFLRSKRLDRIRCDAETCCRIANVVHKLTMEIGLRWQA